MYVDADKNFFLCSLKVIDSRRKFNIRDQILHIKNLRCSCTDPGILSWDSTQFFGTFSNVLKTF